MSKYSAAQPGGISTPIQHLATGIKSIDPASGDSFHLRVASWATDDTLVTYLYDEDGTYQSEFQVGTATYSAKRFQSLCLDEDKNVYLFNGEDGKLYKYNSAGAKQWEAEFFADDDWSIFYHDALDRVVLMQKTDLALWPDADGTLANVWVINPTSGDVEHYFRFDSTTSTTGDGNSNSQKIAAYGNSIILVPTERCKVWTGHADDGTYATMFKLSLSGTYSGTPLAMTVDWFAEYGPGASQTPVFSCCCVGDRNGSDVIFAGNDNSAETGLCLWAIDPSDGSEIESDTPTISTIDFGVIALAYNDATKEVVALLQGPAAAYRSGVAAFDSTDLTSVSWSALKPAGQKFSYNTVTTPKIAVDLDGNVYIAENSYTGEDTHWGDTTSNEEPILISFDSGGSYRWHVAVGDASFSVWDMALDLYDSNATERPYREVVNFAVAAGNVYSMTASSMTQIGSNGVLSMRVNEVMSQVAYQKIYFVDGNDEKVVSFSDLTTLDDWSSDVTDGTLPSDPRLIALYRGRMVLSGLYSDPHNWFMSAVDDPLDWDYSPATTSVTMAVAGNNSDVGLVGDIITALIPYSDDVLLFGGDHSLYLLQGDPAAGGNIDLISDKTGIRFGNAWCRDPYGWIYFMGTTGVYRINSQGGVPESITRGRLDHEWDSIDFEAYRVHMEWDYVRQGFLMLLVPFDYSTSTVYAYWWDARTDSWWKDAYPSSMGPVCMLAVDGDDPDDIGFVFGCSDGYARKVDDDASDDDGTSITAYVDWASLIAGNPDRRVAMTRLVVATDPDSADVDVEIYAGQSIEQAVDASTPVHSRTISGGISTPIIRPISDGAVRIRMASTGGRWAFESMVAAVRSRGLLRRG